MRCRSCGQVNIPGRLYCADCGGSLGHFVGRHAEMDVLRGALEDALSSRGRLILLAGEPGIGKTRTAEELAAHARRRGARVLWGRCYDGEGAPAFWPWLQVIRAYAHARDPSALAAVMGPGAIDIAQIAVEVRERLPQLPAADAIGPEPARFRLFDSIAVFLRNASADEPLVLVLDDLHSADRSSLLLLQFVTPEVVESRVLLIASYRHTELRRRHPLAETLGELARSPSTQRVMLRGLADEDVSRLVETIAGEKPSEAAVAAVCRQTEGNPFFINELVPLLVAEGRLRRGTPASWNLAVPQGVREIIGRRLDGLSPECNRILTLASVIGREFELAVLEGLGGLGRDELLAVLEEALAARLVVEVPRTAGRYAFSHGLIRDTLYEELPTARRMPLHRQIGELLEGREAAEARLAELAYHFFEAAHGGDVGKAVDYSMRAGARAAQQLAYEEAAGHYERALQALDLTEQADGQRCELLLALGDVQMGAGEAPAARASFLRAADVARRARMPARLARAALGLGSGLQGFWGYGAGLVDEALVGLLEEALGELGPEETRLRALLLGRMAVALYWSDSPERRAAIGSLARESVEVADRTGDPTTQLLALASRHWADWRPDNAEDRLTMAREIVRLARTIRDPEITLLGHAFHLADALELGDIATADAEIETFARLAQELRQPRYLWWSAMFRGMRALLAGSFDETERLALEALAIGRRAQASDAAQTFGVVTFTIRRERGGLEELRAATEALSEQYRVRAWRCGVVLLEAELGRAAAARRELDVLAARGFEDVPRDLTWLTTMAVLAEAVALVGDAERATILYDLLRPHAGHCVVIGYGLAWWGSVARYLGLLAARLSRWEVAARHFEAALETNRRMGARLCLARTEYDYAAMLRARGEPGDRKKADGLLAAAAATANELGLERLAEQIEHLERGDAVVPERPIDGPNVFRREGEFWTIAYGGAVVRVRDMHGLHYIAHLLRHPAREFHVRDLVAHGARTNGPLESGSAGAVLDGQARLEYGRRLTALRGELDEAERFNDTGRAERAREEIEFLTEQLAAAVGLGGRNREVAATSERARLAVTKAIRASVRRIHERHPALGRHLDASIKTGQFCAYDPPPDRPVGWTL